MATLNEAKSRLTSVSSTQKIVKAMELVASSKIKKSREKAKDVSFFFETSLNSMKILSENYKGDLIFDSKAHEKTLLVLISSDMGLCGSYNANINKKMLQEIKKSNYELLIVGKKGLNKAEFEKLNIYKSFIDVSNINELDLAISISDEILNEINVKNINNIKIIYTKFINPLVQKVDIIDFLNFDELLKNDTKSAKKIFQVEPDVKTVFNKYFESYIIGIIYSVLLQSFASEHAYRRNSMENANKNSLELIEKLNLKINRIRQTNITQEITEIISGSESLNKE